MHSRDLEVQMEHERREARELVEAQPDDDPRVQHREMSRRRRRGDHARQRHRQLHGAGVTPVLEARQEPDEEVRSDDGRGEEDEADEEEEQLQHRVLSVVVSEVIVLRRATGEDLFQPRAVQRRWLLGFIHVADLCAHFAELADAVHIAADQEHSGELGLAQRREEVEHRHDGVRDDRQLVRSVAVPLDLWAAALDQLETGVRDLGECREDLDDVVVVCDGELGRAAAAEDRVHD